MNPKFDYILKLNSVRFSTFSAEYSLLEHVMFVEKIINAEKQHLNLEGYLL
jgi:hypothetical protein